MLDVVSALATVQPVNFKNVSMAEAPGFTLTQVAGADKDLKKAFGKLPAKVGVTLQHDDRTLMRVGPKQIWVLGAAPEPANGIFVTSLSSGRARIMLSGEGARDVLASCAAIDFHPAEFKPGHFVMTGIHHTPVLINCIGAKEFHIYTLRTFARAVWEWLEDAARGVAS
jgi:heterotetrameric sarcosine oxidase gamma subunit